VPQNLHGIQNIHKGRKKRMGWIRVAIIVCFAGCNFSLAAETIPDLTVYQSCFEKRERDISSFIDYHLGMVTVLENYTIDKFAVKSAKENLEYIRAKIQVYNNKCIDVNEAMDYITSMMETKFVNLTEYDIDKYKESFYPCTSADLTRRLYVQYEQKKPLPPKIEYGITICAIGYFVWLIPFPPIKVCGYAIMAYGAEKIVDGYFSEKDRQYEQEHRNE